MYGPPPSLSGGGPSPATKEDDLKSQLTVIIQLLDACYRSLRNCLIAIILLAATGILVWFAISVLASPAYPLPAGGDTEWTAWAQKWEHNATRERAKLAKHTRVLSLKAPRPLPTAESFVTTATVDGAVVTVTDWHAYGQRCKDLTSKWRKRRVQLHHRLTHPGGSGAARWMPLARYVGWPDHALPMLRKVIWRESNGDPSQVTPPYGATGLMQWIRPWWSGQWALPAFDPYNPATNLRMGLRLWHMQGGSFLPAWRLTAW